MTPQDAPTGHEAPVIVGQPARRLAWLIFALTGTGVSVNMLVIASLPEIVAGVGAGPGQAGMVVAAAAFPGIAGGPVIGLLADRYGRRVVLIPSLLLIAMAGGLATTSPTLMWLLTWRLLQGMGAAGAINLATVLIGDHWDETRRATMMGRNAAVMTTCTAVFPLIGGAVTDAVGWQGLFAVYLLAAGTAALTAVRLPAQAAITTTQPLDDLRAALRRPGVVRALAAAGVTFTLVFGLMLTVLPLHLQAAYGLGPTTRGVLLAAPAGVAALVALGAGRLQRFTKQALLSTAAVLFTIGLVAAAAAPALALLLAGVVCFGAGQGLMVPNLHDIAARSSDTGRGALMSLLFSASRVGQTAGPVAAATAMSALGAAATFALGASIAALVLLPVVAGRFAPGPTGK